MYCTTVVSRVGAHSRVSAHSPVFGLVSVSAHVPGKRPPHFFSIQTKRPPPLTHPPTVSVSRSACSRVHIKEGRSECRGKERKEETCNSQATKQGQNNAGHVQNKKRLTTAHQHSFQGQLQGARDPVAEDARSKNTTRQDEDPQQTECH